MKKQNVIGKAKAFLSQATAYLFVLIAFLLPTSAFADLTGGLSKAQSNIQTVVTSAMTIAGIAAGGYLLWKAVQAWQGRCEITEFLMSAFWVAVAGGSILFAAFLFGVFG